jgi:hypothetical protein
VHKYAYGADYCTQNILYLAVGVNVYDELLEILECGENGRNKSIFNKKHPIFRVFLVLFLTSFPLFVGI